MPVSDQPLVGIIMGSTSDAEVVQKAQDQLDAFELPYELMVASAHRSPDKVRSWAEALAGRGVKVVIAAAGKAAALPGVVAGFTTLPVIGVPIKTSDLGGLDSLLSIVQMPSGVPVATVAINGAKNAAILACQIVATGDAGYAARIQAYKEEMANA